MEKDKLLDDRQLEGLTAAEIWKELYGKELSGKKNILEYIEITRVLKKGNVSDEQIKDTYNFIYDRIEGLKDCIKPNTIMYLKNSLKAQLGKFVKEKDPKPVNYFIEFFKEAYPENNRRKDFTWVLMDITSISEEQGWTTLTYINKRCLSDNLKLNYDQKKDIIKVIEILVNKGNIKFINNVKSLKGFTDILGIGIIKADDKFKVQEY